MSDQIQLSEVMGHDDEGTCALYVKGRHDLEAVKLQAIQEFKRQYDEDINPTVTHEQWRVMPHKDPDGYDISDSRFVSGTGRGAFWVTCATIREWLR